MTVTITTSHLYRPVLFAQHIIIYAVKRKIIGMGGSCGQEEGSHSQPAGQKSQFHKIRLSLVFRILLSKSKSPGMDNKKAWTCHFVYAYRGIAKHRCHIYE